MNRPQRTVKAPQRLINEPTQQPKKRTLTLDVPKVEVKDNIVDDVINKPKVTTRKTKTGTKSTLHLDLNDVPPSSDKKFRKDWGTDEFWQTNFYTPKDNITKLYKEATEKLKDILPANFMLYPGVEGAIGIANLEIKNEFKKPIKKNPLYSKLVNKDYEISTSKSDKNIADSIKFFRNNLPSFQKYKNDDDISWVITHHRLLTVELLNYYANQQSKRVATIKGRINAITRIFRIAYETKNYDLYDKYSTLVIFLGSHFEDDEFNNELSEIEMKKFITFDIVLDKQKQLQKSFDAIDNKLTSKAYDLNQDLLLLSLYSLIPPLRNEIKKLKFTKTIQKTEDWIVIKPDEVALDLNEEKKRHNAIYFNLTDDAPELAKILRQSFELYPRTFVFTHLKKYPDVSNQATPQSLDDRITKLFTFTGKMVSVNTFRSSYVTYINSEAIKNGRQLTVKEKEKVAYKMRTSRKYLDEAYLKIFPIVRQELKKQDETVANDKEEPKAVEQLPAYQRQLERNKRYYDNNKEKVLKKQKEYKDSRPLYDKARVRMLHFLNNDPDYYNKMKQQTKDKYNFKKENGRWI